MWVRLRFRLTQAVALAVLAALVTICACLGPLYQRAMEQALGTTSLAGASVTDTAITATAVDLTPQRLGASLPVAARPFVDRPVESVAVRVSTLAPIDQTVALRLFAATGLCARLVITRGRCPEDAGEVMVSSRDAQRYGFEVGTSQPIEEKLDSTHQFDTPVSGTVQIVGVYQTRPADTGVGLPVAAPSGTQTTDGVLLVDDWVTVAATVTTARAVAAWTTITSTAVWPLDRSAVADVDDLLLLGSVVERYIAAGLTLPGAGPVVDVTSDLPALADGVAQGRDQSRVTVAALTLQLVLLALVVFWLVLEAAVEQRRPEVALTRLRGRGARGATRFLQVELVPIILTGVLVGGVATLGVVQVTAGLVLPASVPVELTVPFLLAWGGSAFATLLVLVVAVRRTVRTPIADLLRGAARSPSKRAAGVAEVALVVFSGTAVVAFVTGNLQGVLGTAAPALLALGVAMVLGRLLVPATALLGRWFLARGNAVVAAGLLQAARRPVTRRVLVLVVISTSLALFTSLALATGDRNRQNAAEQSTERR